MVERRVHAPGRVRFQMTDVTLGVRGNMTGGFADGAYPVVTTGTMIWCSGEDGPNMT